MKQGKIIDVNNTTSWWVNGKLHREYGPALIYADGSEEWYINGRLHREDGPAVIFKSGFGAIMYEWWIDGNRHREDGPAVVITTGAKAWFLNGVEVSAYDVLGDTEEASWYIMTE